MVAVPLVSLILGLAVICTCGLHSSHTLELLGEEAARNPKAQEVLLDGSSMANAVTEHMVKGKLGVAGTPTSSHGPSTTLTDLRQRVLAEMLGNYAHAPEPEQWAQLLEHALSSPQDPCDADVLSTFGWNSGWGSGFNVLASEVAVAAYFNRTVALCNPPHIDLSMWSVLQGPLRVCTQQELCADLSQYGTEGRLHWGYSTIFWGGCSDHDECDVTLTRMPKKPPAQRHPGISPTFRVFSKRFRHLVYERIYHFNPETEAFVKQLVYLIGPPIGPYVGVHLRGNEKFKEAVDVGVAPYVNHALHLANLTHARAVFLASDDYNRSLTFKSAFEAVAPSNVSLHMKPVEAYPWVKGGNNIIGTPRAVFMAEINLLRDAAAFVGSASSNVGRLVYFLRPVLTTSEGDTLDVSVDEDNDFFSRHC